MVINASSSLVARSQGAIERLKAAGLKKKKGKMVRDDPFDIIFDIQSCASVTKNGHIKKRKRHHARTMRQRLPDAKRNSRGIHLRLSSALMMVLSCTLFLQTGRGDVEITAMPST